ncbi:NAD(P)/FAD-dependent oxidoreductase [Nonomuraea ceibae]|uniref:NAD(P)/FAD-dependent oxidoreductase n=1 Tax=Nonomuraea ceibae TaxID=1935170 RepID=UPI001C5F0D8B|nr:FAD-dependent oxidoreductase [Nonomuraea ceibae]
MNIVVIGAGYAGLTAALRLDRTHHITLISAEAHFTQRIRLHELAAGRPTVRVPLAELTRGTGIETVVARVAALDPSARVVRTEDGREFGYDTLVYALGSRTDVRVPGVAEHAYTAESAAALRTRLASGGGDVAVVGGGLTGVEMAAELAETYPAWRVTLVSGNEPVLSARGRRHVAGALSRLGVITRYGVRASGVSAGTVHTTDGDISADVVVWAGSFTVPTLAAEAGLTVDARGRAVVDATMRSVSHPDVYVVGDAAAVRIPGAGESRMSCAAGMPIAAHAADSVNARAAGRQARPFRFRYLIQCVSLGRHDGLIQFVRHDDSPVETVLRGRLAAFVKEQVCRFTVGSLRLERRRPGTYLWPKGKARTPAAPLTTTR